MARTARHLDSAILMARTARHLDSAILMARHHSPEGPF